MGTPLIFECPGDSVYVYNGEKKRRVCFSKKKNTKSYMRTCKCTLPF